MRSASRKHHPKRPVRRSDRKISVGSIDEHLSGSKHRELQVQRMVQLSTGHAAMLPSSYPGSCSARSNPPSRDEEGTIASHVSRGWQRRCHHTLSARIPKVPHEERLCQG
jgi:hypothetical protein